MAESKDNRWTFLTNHSHVLICLCRDPELRIRDIAPRVGITERMVQRILNDLAEASILEVVKEGRRNRYRINPDRHLRHDLESHRTVADLLALVGTE